MARLNGVFDIECFEAALQALILRHKPCAPPSRASTAWPVRKSPSRPA
ncbi:hypothetical protein F2S70_23040 [Pseudomonas syringae pv. actinidiae]|nr:hypothetical protein [Pseudomonas syringae pv. actinidiae]